MGATPVIIKYPLDLTGSAPSNAIVNESHTVPRGTSRGFALDYGPFYSKSLVIRRADTGVTLLPHVDYIALHQYQEATLVSGQEICAAVLITNTTYSGELLVDYQVVGGGFSSCVSVIQDLVDALQLDNRNVAWGDIIGKLEEFPPSPHYHDLDDFYGFEYMIAALDRIEAAIMHGDYYDHELLRQRIANLRNEVLQMVQDQEDALTLHLADFANPHKVTKAQTGLGYVDNFPTAVRADAEGGTSNQLFMTPLMTFYAIIKKAGELLKVHTDRTDNPHSVTQAQVGLGLVQNYGIATDAESQAGVATNKYMTPYQTKIAISKQAGDLLNTHIANTNNPHAVTKAQVGLGNVDNYATAVQAEAQTTAATSTLATDKFMTIRRVAEMMDARTPLPLQNHLNNTSNPHNTTAAQVGLGNVQNYGIAAASDVDGALTTSNASNALYVTPLRLVQYIVNRLGNVVNYGIATQAEAEDTSTSTSSNAKYMTPLRVLQAINKRVWNDFNAHVANTSNPHNTTAAQVGLGNVDNYDTASQAEAQVVSDSSTNAKFMTPWLTFRSIITHLGRTDSASVLNNAVNHMNNGSNPHNTTAAQVGLGNVQNYGIASQADAQGGTNNGVYSTPLRVWQAIAQYLANVGFSTIQAHLSRTDNPHNTTKAQVGLGSVDNFATANQAEAQVVSDSSTNAKFMTPWLTFRSIITHLGRTDSASVLNNAVNHMNNTGNPHGTTKAQVGLGNVQNYGIASTGDAYAMSSDSLYMTPLKTSNAITQWCNANVFPNLNAVVNHMNTSGNPHNTTAAHVGLGNVQNYGIASTSDAYAMSSDSLYMTPVKTSNAIAQWCNANVFPNLNAVVNHMNTSGNPHNTTAAQIGLGSVPNWGAATSAMVTPSSIGSIGLTNDSSFMSPRKTFEAIINWFSNKISLDVTVTADANVWTKVGGSWADFAFYTIFVTFGGTTSTGGYTYYAGSTTFGALGGRSHSAYGNVGTGDVTNMTLASPGGSTNGNEGIVLFGVGSYGESCRVAMFPDGLYVRWNRCINSAGNPVENSACGSIGIRVRARREDLYTSF